MGKLWHGLAVPDYSAYAPDETDAILLEYECAYIDANGTDPLLRKISDDVYAIDDIGMSVEFHIYEFPLMTRTLWEVVAYRNDEEHAGPIVALFKRLVSVKLSDTLEKLHGSAN